MLINFSFINNYVNLLYVFLNYLPLYNFRRTQLNDKEHDLVIKTLCSYIGKLKPQEIPPLLQQILHFCSSGEFLNLFCTLQKYFDDKYLLYQTDNTNNELQIGTYCIYLLDFKLYFLLILFLLLICRKRRKKRIIRSPENNIISFRRFRYSTFFIC